MRVGRGGLSKGFTNGFMICNKDFNIKSKTFVMNRSIISLAFEDQQNKKIRLIFRKNKFFI